MAIDNMERRSMAAVAGADGVLSPRVSATGTSVAGNGAEFSKAMNRILPDGLISRVPSVGSVRESYGSGRFLNDLSQYLTGRNEAVSRMVHDAVRTGSPDQILKVNAALIDRSIETDLLAKAIGKTVSVVDQLTKLN